MTGRLEGLLSGWPDVPVTVCTAHLRFIPCRHGSDESPCVLSDDPADVEMTREYQESRKG